MMLMFLSCLAIAAGGIAVIALGRLGVATKRQADLQTRVATLTRDNQRLQEALSTARGYLFQATTTDLPGRDGAIRTLDRMDTLTKENTQ